MCGNQTQILGLALVSAGVGMILSLLLGSTFLQILLALGLTAAGIVFLTR